MKFDVIQSMWSSRTLRISYQQEAVDGLNSYADVQKPGSLQSGLLVMPAGTGKTYTEASEYLGVAKSTLRRWEDKAWKDSWRP